MACSTGLVAFKGERSELDPRRYIWFCRRKKKEELPACRGEGSAAGLQLRVRVVSAALLAMLRTALALRCVLNGRVRGSWQFAQLSVERGSD
jgi:hypothetical protein